MILQFWKFLQNLEYHAESVTIKSKVLWEVWTRTLLDQFNSSSTFEPTRYSVLRLAPLLYWRSPSCPAGAWWEWTLTCRMLISTSAPLTAGLQEPIDATWPLWRWVRRTCGSDRDWSSLQKWTVMDIQSVASRPPNTHTHSPTPLEALKGKAINLHVLWQNRWRSDYFSELLTELSFRFTSVFPMHTLQNALYVNHAPAFNSK